MPVHLHLLAQLHTSCITATQMDAKDARNDGTLTKAPHSRTAWLNGPEEVSDEVVRRVNARLGTLVGLELEGTELCWFSHTTWAATTTRTSIGDTYVHVQIVEFMYSRL